MTKTLFPYQERGVDFLVNGGSLLADEQGLGKTLQLIRAFKAYDPSGIGVVTAPSAVQGVWERELEEEGLVPFLVTSDRLKKLDQAVGTFDIAVVSADLPGRNEKVQRALKSLQPEVLICDEADLFKTEDAKRTQAVLLSDDALAKDATTWLATGTPTPNHVGELWSLITATQPARIGEMSRASFEAAYCDWKLVRRPGRGGKKILTKVISGTNRVSVLTLRKDLREPGAGGQPWWLRRKKADVLPELPEKLRRIAPMMVKNLREFTELEESEEGQALLDAVRSGDFARDQEDDEDLHMARIRRLLALMKADAVAEYAQEKINTGHEKLIIWGWHTEALQRVHEKLQVPSEVMTGATPKAKRDAFVSRFQNTPGKVLVGCQQIRAMGAGITQTAASIALFMEGSWTPRDNLQAEDRIHRIGQTRGCLNEYLCVRDSIDEAVMAVIARKTEDWERLEKSALESVT